MFNKKLYMKQYRQKYNVAKASQIGHSRKLYYTKRKKQILIVQSKYQARKRKTDLNYKIGQNLRSRVANAISRQFGTKAFKTIDLIGCTISDLKSHLKRQFQYNMSWSNYGRWEIDHIKPCALFDLTNVEEQKRCFHYTNLQPLWAEDNRRKNSKYGSTNYKI